MHHPYPIAALIEDRSRICPCGAVAERPWTLCRKCSARAAWRRKNARKTTRKATQTSRRAARRLPARQRRLPLLRARAINTRATKGAEN